MRVRILLALLVTLALSLASAMTLARDNEPRRLPPLPLCTEGRWIVDSTGARFKLAGVNWYGAEEEDFVVAGLDRRPVEDIARTIRELGFNCVRLPWSNELVERNPVVATAAVTANPGLRGKRALDVLDAVVSALAAEGLVVVLDNHVSRACWVSSPKDADGLWWTEEYPEEKWIEHWRVQDVRPGHATGDPRRIGDVRSQAQFLTGAPPLRRSDVALAAEKLILAPHVAAGVAEARCIHRPRCVVFC